MFCPKHNWPRSHSRHCRQQAKHHPSQPYHDYADPARIKRDLRPEYKPQQYFNPYMYPPPTGYGERDVRSCKARPPRPHTYEDFMNESAKFLYNKRNKNDRPGTQDTPSEINWMANNFDVWKPTPEKEQFETNDWPPPPPPTSAYNPPQVIQKNRSLRDRITTPDDPVTEEEMNWSKPLSPSLAKWLPKDVVPHSKDSKLYEMFRKQLMCDVVILTADGTIQAHKIALCLRSSALVDIFSYYSGNDVFRLDLSDFKGEVIIAVLIYVYTGQLHLTPDIVGQVMLCAQRCQMDHLIDRCRQFMYNSLNVSTAVLFYSIAANNNDLKLREDAFNMIVDNFADVCQTTHFMLLPFDRLRPILDNGALKIRNEKDVFDAVINWVNFSPSKRIPVAHHLLSCVRLRYIPPEQLAEEAEQNDWLLTDVNCLRYCVYETMRYHVIHRKTACEVASESSHSLNYQHMEPPPEKVNYKRFPPSTNNQSNMHHPTVVHPMNYGYIPDVNYDCLQKDGIEGGCFGKRLGEPGLNPYYDGSSCDSQITHEDVLRDDLLYPYPLNQTEKRTYVYPKTFVPRNATPPCIDPMLPVRGMSASALYNEMQTEKSEKNAYIPSGTATKLFQRLQQQIHHYKQALSNRPSVSQHEVQQLAQELMHLSRELLHTHKAASSVPSVQRNLEVYPSQAHSRASRSHKLFSNEVSVVRLRPPAMKRDLTSMFEPVGRIGPKQNLMPFQPLLSTDSKRSDFEVVNEEKAFFNKISVGGLAAIKSAGHQKAQKPSPFQPQIASTQSQPCPQPKPQPKPHPKPHPKPQPKPQQSENTFIAKQEAISAQISEEVENVTSIVSNVPTQTQVVQQIWDMDSDKSLKSMEKRSPPPAPPEQKEKERMSEKQMAPNSGSAATKMEITLNQLQVKQPKKPIARVVKGCEARTSTPNLDHFDRNFSTRLFEIPEQIGDAVINKTDFLRPNLIPTSARSEKKLTFAANTAFQPRGRGSAPRTLVKVKNTNRSNCEHFNNQNNKLQNSSERFTSRCYVDRDGDRAFGCCNQNNSKCSLNTYLKHWSIEKELDKINKTTHGCKKMRVNSCPSKSISANKTQQVHFHRSLKKCCTKSKKVFLCPTCSRHLEVHHSRSAHGNDHSDNRTKKAKLKNLHQKPDYHQMNTNQNARTSENDEEVADEKERLDALNALKRSSPCNARFEDCSHSDFEDASAFPEKCCTKSKKVFLCPTCSRHLEVHHSRSAHGNDHSDNQTKKTKLKNLHQKPDYLQMNTNQNARTSEDDEEVADEKERLDALSAPRRSSPCNARFEDCSNSDFDDAKLKNLHQKPDYLQMKTNQNARTSEDEEEVAGEKERLDTLSAPQRSSPCNARFEDCSNSDFEDAITFPENDKYENSKERISERINSDQTLSSKPLDYSKSSKNVNVEASKLTAEELEENEDSEIKKRFKVSHDLLKRDKVGEVSPELRHIPGKSLVKVSEACKELLSFVEVYGRLELNGREINLEKEETTGNVALNDSHVDIDKLHSGLSKATQSEREKLSIPMSSKFCQCSCLPCHNCAHICQAKVSEHNLSRCSVNRLTNVETRVSNNAKLNKSCTNLEIVVPHAQPRNIEKDTTLSNNLGRLMGDNPGSTEFDKVNRKMGRKSDQATKIECQGSDECAEGPSSYTCNFPNLINPQRPEFPKSVLLSPPKLELNGFPVQSIYFPEEVVETVSPDTTTPLNLKPKNSRQSNQNSLNKIENILIACNHVNDNSLDGKAGNSKSSLNVRKPKKHPRSDDSYSSEVCMFIFGGVDVKYNLRTNGVEFVKGSSLVLRIDSSDRCANFRRLSQVWIRPSWSSFFRWELENLLRCECVLVDRKLHVFGGAVDRRSMELQSPPNSEESCESDVSEVQTLGVLSEHSMGMSEFQSFAHVSTLLLSNQLQEDSLIITKSHDIFDFDTEKWSTGASMPQSLIHFSVAFWDSKIFIVGGISMKDEQQTNNGEYLSNFSLDDRMSNDKYAKNSGQKNFSEAKLRNRLLYYDSVSNEWSECSTTPFDNPAIGLSVAVFNDDLFVVGGMSVLELPKSPRTLLERCKILDSVYKLNLPSLDFKDTRPCNFKVDLTPGKEFQNDLTEFFTAENQCAFRRSLRSRGIWKKLKPLKMPRSFGNLVVVKEKLLLVGGLLEGAAESTVEVYDPSSDRWEFFLTLSSPRYAMRCAVMGSNMYVSGGFTSDGQRFCTKKENETDCKEPFCHCRASDLIEAINLTDDDFPKTFVLTRLPLKKIGFQSVMIDATNVLS